MTKSISSERLYTRRVLPAAVIRGLKEAVRGHVSGGLRSLAIVAGFTVVMIGFLVGHLVLLTETTGIRRGHSAPTAAGEELTAGHAEHQQAETTLAASGADGS